jgi:hypothetical protein
MIPAPLKPTIQLELLEKIDIRVGTIRSVTDIPKLRQTGPIEGQLWRPRTDHRRRYEEGTR